MDTAALPPLYEAPTSPFTNEDSLPAYAPRAVLGAQPLEQKDFEYNIEKKKGEALVVLRVTAATLYSRHIPTFLGTGPVKGSVTLNLKEPDTILSVAVSVRGRFLSGHADEEVRFFDISTTLWSKNIDEASSSPRLNKKKLQGTHSWTFSVDIPEKVQLLPAPTSSAQQDQHYLPQTFNERNLRASVRYEIIARIGRSKLKPDYKIPCAFGYIPIIRPPPFHPLKALAYREGSTLLDPTIDIDGWTSAEKVNVSGTLFNSRPAEIECQLFMSAPLTYTRGSVIPLYLQMKSNDQQALDLLAIPKSVIVRLHRSLRYHVPSKNLRNPDNYHAARGKYDHDIVEAIWWPCSSTQLASTDTRCLSGELHLKADLVPSSTFPTFIIEYSVVLYAFDSPGFKMTQTDEILSEHCVDVVTSYAPGPRAVRSAPPGYDSERRFVHDGPGTMLLTNSFV